MIIIIIKQIKKIIPFFIANLCFTFFIICVSFLLAFSIFIFFLFPQLNNHLGKFIVAGGSIMLGNYFFWLILNSKHGWFLEPCTIYLIIFICRYFIIICVCIFYLSFFFYSSTLCTQCSAAVECDFGTCLSGKITQVIVGFYTYTVF